MWQKESSSSLTRGAYHALEPQVSGQVKYTDKNRSKKTKTTCLRMGKCRLNKCLHDINTHPDGLCETCKVPESETIAHVLLDCIATDIPMKLKARCAQLKTPSTLNNMMRLTPVA